MGRWKEYFKGLLNGLSDYVAAVGCLGWQGMQSKSHGKWFGKEGVSLA